MSLSLNKPKLDNLANEIRKSAERLRGKFKAYEYKGVILPIIAIRRQISQAEIGAVRGGKLIAASDDSILQPQLSWEKDCIEAAAVIKCSGKFFMF